MSQLHILTDDLEHYPEWVEAGMARLTDYLAKCADLDQYCAMRGHRSHSKTLREGG